MKKLFNLPLIILLLTACKDNIPTSMPDIGIVAELNQRIELTTPEGWNSFIVGKPITIEIKNTSADSIMFDANYGVRMFVYQTETWKEVSDGLTSYYNDSIVLKQYLGSAEDTGVISVLPKLENRSQKVLLRVFIIGVVISNDNQVRKVGSYIDIYLRP